MVITATYQSKFKAVENAKEQVMNMHYRMREQGVPVSAPHRVLGRLGIKFFEFDSKQKLLDIMSQHCRPLDEWPYVEPCGTGVEVRQWFQTKGSDRKGTGLKGSLVL